MQNKQWKSHEIGKRQAQSKKGKVLWLEGIEGFDWVQVWEKLVKHSGKLIFGLKGGGDNWKQDESEGLDVGPEFEEIE